MSADNLKDIVSILSPTNIILILSFFIPGLLFCVLFNYINYSNYKETKFNTILLSIVISFLINNLAELVSLSEKVTQSIYILIINLFSIGSSVGISYLYKYLIKKRKLARTLSSDIWEFIFTKFSLNKTNYVDVYLHDGLLIHGQLSLLEENNNPDIILENYRICKTDEKLELTYASDTRNESIYYIKNEQIKSIEFYDK